MKELQRGGSPNIVIALAGNKTDLSIKRKVQSEVRGRAQPALLLCSGNLPSLCERPPLKTRVLSSWF